MTYINEISVWSLIIFQPLCPKVIKFENHCLRETNIAHWRRLPQNRSCLPQSEDKMSRTMQHTADTWDSWVKHKEDLEMRTEFHIWKFWSKKNEQRWPGTIVLPYSLRILSKSPSGYLKPQIVTKPICSMCFPIHRYIQESLIYKLGTVRDKIATK
jgi:membrane-bound lytic murein transglycosylase